jgi:hypothetical protein
LRALNHQGQGQAEQGQAEQGHAEQGQAEQGQAEQDQAGYPEGQADQGLPQEGLPEEALPEGGPPQERPAIMVLHKHMLCVLYVCTCSSCCAPVVLLLCSGRCPVLSCLGFRVLNTPVPCPVPEYCSETSVHLQEAVVELLSDEDFKNNILALLIFCGAMDLREGTEPGVYYLKVKVNIFA